MGGRIITLSLVSLALGFSATGCATKKYVKSNIEPLEARIGTVEQTTKEHDGELTKLDQRIETGLSDAVARADSAAKSAEAAGKEASNARSLAEKGLTQVGAVENKLANVHNYQPAGTATVFFAFDSAELSDEARQELDQFAQKFKGMSHYLVEIQGFTDTVGDAGYNIQLSNRRAEAVARYLSASHQVPLAKISMLGYGKDLPAADNKTSDGRKQNRRVEVRVLAPQMGAAAQQASSATPTT